MNIDNVGAWFGIEAEAGFVAGIQGEIAIRSSTHDPNPILLDAGVEFNFDAEIPIPDAIIIEERTGTVSLVGIIHTFTSQPIPSAIQSANITLSAFKLDIIGNPSGVTVEGIHYGPSIHFAGTLTVAKITVIADVDIEFTRGVRAYGYLSPVSLGNVLQITAAGDTTKGAYLLVDTHPTGSNPYISASFYLRFFGFNTAVQALVSANTYLDC